MTQAAVYTALQAFLATVLGLSSSVVQVERRSTVRHNQPGVWIRELRDAAVGRGELIDDEVHEARRLLVQVEGRGTGPAVDVQRVATLLNSDSPDVDTLTTAGVGVVAVGPLRDLTRLGGHRFEQVTAFDLTLSYTATVASSAAGSASTISTTLDDGGGPLVLDVLPIP